MLVFRADVPDEVKRKRAPRRRQPIKKGMRPIGPTVGNELRLRKVINGIVMNAASFTREHGLPIASSLKEQMSVDHMMRDDIFQLNSFMSMLRNHLEQQTSQLPRWLRPIFESEEQNHRSNFTSSVKTTFGIDITSVVRSSDVQPQFDLAMSQSVNLITGMTDELAKRVQTVLTTSAIQGKRADETASMMSEQFGWSLKRSKLIARDQMATFNGVLNKVRQTQNGFDKYIWSTSQDERVRPEHAAREGKIYSWDDPPEDGNPGEPINCFPGSSIVDLSNGCNKLWRRFYNGPIVSIMTSQGRFLQATPNHPILTNRGWLTIDNLQESDYVISRSERAWIAHKDVNHLVTSFDDLFNTLSIAHSIDTAHGSPFDFHGDGTKNDVNVITVDSDLLSDLDTGSVERFCQLLFSGADVNVLIKELNIPCSIDATGKRLTTSTQSFMSRLSELLTFIRCQFAHTNEIGRTGASSGNHVVTQDSSNNIAANLKFFSEGKLAFPVDVSVNNLLLRQIVAAIMRYITRFSDQSLGAERLGELMRNATQFNTNLTHCLPLGYQPDCVVKKTFSEFVGHVYNLNTTTNFYIANGVVVHNCRCVARAYVDVS